MKRRKKNNNKYYVITTLIIILFITTGYSLFSDSLSISGNAKSEPYVYGPDLNIELIKNGDNYISGTMPIRATLESEVLTGNRLTITFRKTDQNRLFYTTILNINFRNIYQKNLTNGKMSRSTPSGQRGFSVMSVNVNKKTLVPNETAEMTIKFNFINFRATSPAVMNTTLEYKIEGTVQKFYVDVVMI